MASHLQTLVGSCKIAVLAQTKMWAICTHEAGTDDWLHVATYTFVLAMGC